MLTEDKYQQIKNKNMIAFLFNMGNEKDVVFNDNILLKQTSDEEKENFDKYDKDSLVDKSNVSHCLKFTIDDKFVEEIGLSINKKTLKRLSIKSWKDMDVDSLEYEVIDNAIWRLIKLVEAINISKKEPCEILRIDLYDGDKYVEDEWEDCKVQYFGDCLECVINEKDVKPITKIYNLLLEADQGYNSRSIKNHWWITAVEYFIKYTESSLTADQLIDLTIALESLLSRPNEKTEMTFRFSQRASMYLYDIGGYYPNQVLDLVKIWYDLRSKIVHGSVTLWDPEKEDVKLKDYEIKIGSDVYKLEGQKISLYYVMNMFREILRMMLFDAMLNHSNESKDEFLKYIDSSWYKYDDIKKCKLFEPTILLWSLKKT